LIAVGVIAAIFLTYEMVERLWLADTNMSTLYSLHIIRGVGASLIVGLIVGWYFLRKGGSIFPSAEVPQDQVQQKERVSQRQMIYFSTWFIQMRWLAGRILTDRWDRNRDQRKAHRSQTCEEFRARFSMACRAFMDVLGFLG
jgi:hypothetical protein